MDVRTAEPELDPIVAEVLAGNESRFRGIVEILERPVRAVVAALLPDPAAVDDVVCEVFFTVYRKLSQYKPGTDLRAWVNTFARNLALNERRRWLNQRALRRDLRLEIEEAGESLVTAVADALEDDRLDALRSCLQELAPTARAVVQTYYFEGRSTPEIARGEGRRETWVRNVLSRARAALARCVAAKGKNRALVSHG